MQPSEISSNIPKRVLPTTLTHTRHVWQLIVGVVIFVVVYIFVDFLVLSAFSRIEVDMEASVSSEVMAHYSTTAWHTHFNEKQISSSAQYEAGKRSKVKLRLDNRTIKKLRLDPGSVPGIYKIYKIELFSFFGTPIEIIPYAPDLPIIPGPETEIIKRDGYLEVVAHNDDPYCYFNKTLSSRNIYFQFGTPLVFAILAIIVVSRTRPSEWKFWRDTQVKKSSSGANYQALNGLRGLAALTVLLDHTGVPGCDGVAMAGVVTFITLSGFLLTVPFAWEGKRILNRNFIENYFFRRVCRIVPMFYAIIVLHYFFNGRLEDAVRSALFLEGDGIYWTVLQEMHFYVFLPLIMLVNHLLFRNNKWLIVIFLFILGFCFNHGILHVYRIYYMGNSQPLLIGLFLGGMMTCYLLHIPAIQNSRLIAAVFNNHLVAAIPFIGIIFSPFLWPLITRHNFSGAYLLSNNFCYTVQVLIFAMVLADRSIIAKILCAAPLRVLGTVSYSFYLLHPIVIRAVKSWSVDYLHTRLDNTTSCALALVLTLMLAAVTYTLIERPFVVKEQRNHM